MSRRLRSDDRLIVHRASRRLGFEWLESRRMMAAFDVLVFSKTAGFRHDSIDEGIAAIQALGAAHDFSVVATEDATAFTGANLAQFEAVVFLSTTGDVLNAAQQTAMENYIHAGGGFVGVHAAADTEYGWSWYGDLMGAYFSSHPAIQQATVVVADHVHGSTAHLPDRWVRTDEWYNYAANPRGDVHVLATLDESTYSGGVGGNGGVDHPISWYHYFEGGRSWYTGMGHTASSYAEPLYLEHLLGGIQFAAGQAPADLGGTVDANWQKVVLEEDVNAGVSLAVAPTGDVFFVEFGGAVKVHHPSTGMTTVAATIPVFRQGEDGMLAIALDPNFVDNHWVYLYFSPAGSNPVNHLSRFTMVGNTLDVNSQEILLEVPVNRVQPGQSDGHAGASLAFGPDGLLYLSTGDDTVPFESSGYSPIDERPDREVFDAQRSSANTNDLRGKILRIKPEDDGTYSIPEGNLYVADATHRPEIYTMGHRNPYRISVDSETGWLYWGDVGPDASNDSSSRGPRGYDEINQAREAGNFGWPYVIADNKAYRDYDFATGVSGAPFNPAALVNNSPNNTGATNLPEAQPAFIWYPYSNSLGSNPFPEMRISTSGSNSRTSMAGPVYHFDPTLDSDVKLPEYFDDALIVYDWSRDAFWEVQLDGSGKVLKINRMFPNLAFAAPIDAEMGPDGALYILEWGVADNRFSTNNPDAQLVRVEFVGNLPTLLGDYNGDGSVGAADYTVWRDTLGQSGLAQFDGADGNGDGRITDADYNILKSHFGQSLPNPNSGAGAESTVAAAAEVEAPLVASIQSTAASTSRDTEPRASVLSVDSALSPSTRTSSSRGVDARHVTDRATPKFAVRDNALADWWESSRRAEQRRGGGESLPSDAIGTDESTESWRDAVEEMFCRLADRRLA
ncbi:MAG: ThuA domain-containing protein [Pirellulales bacterium]